MLSREKQAHRSSCAVLPRCRSLLPALGRGRGAHRRRRLHERAVRALSARRHVVPALRPARPRHQGRATSACAPSPAGRPSRCRTPRTPATRRRAATSGACTGTARTSRRPPRRRPTGCCASSPSTTARRCGSTGAGSAGTRAATCRSSWRPRACAAAPTAWSCASTAGAPRRPSRRSACATAASTWAAGGTTPASCARSTCGEVDTFDFVNVFARPRLDCPTCDARIYVRAVVANMERVPARAEVSATVGGKRIRFTPTTIGAARLPPVPRQRGNRLPAALEPRGPASLHGRAGGLARRPGRAALHAAHRHPQHRARRARPHAAERPPSDAARGQHARGGPGARRRAAPGRHPRELRAAARAGRQHDALALPDAPARARAGGPLRHRRLVRGARSTRCATSCSAAPPCARRAVQQVRDMVNRDRSHPVGDRLEPRQREHLEAGPRLHALRDGRGAAGAAPRPDAARGPRVPRLSDGRQAEPLHEARRPGRERLLRLVRRAAGLDHATAPASRRICSACTTTIRGRRCS